MDMDRLSKLPEDVLDKILCFLPQKEAVRTCLLSRSWRYSGSSRSKLELSEIDDFNWDKKKFISVLDNSLQWYRDQNLCVKQLTLKMYLNSEAKYDLNSIAPTPPESIVEFCLEGCDLTNSTHHFSFKNLRKLSLRKVRIANQTLEMLLSTSLIQYLELCDLMELGDSDKGLSINLPTLDTHDYFHRLKYLKIQRTLLSADSFTFFSSNYMPTLEEFHLSDCDGLEEFHLSNHSIKYLHISGMDELIKATIDAPNLVYFKFVVPVLSPTPSISFTPISSEWKSDIELGFLQYTYNEAVNELLKALSQS